MVRICSLLRLTMSAGICAVAVTGVAASMKPTPAFAQFGWIFGDDDSSPPPRPPGDVGRRIAPPPLQPIQPLSPPPMEPPPEQQMQPAQRQARPDTRPSAIPSGIGGVESQPLPPLDGAAPAPEQEQANQPPPARALPGLPAGQRQPRTTPGQPQPPTTLGPEKPVQQQPQQTDQAFVQPPMPHVANPGAVFAGLDKITGRITSFDVALGETVQFGALQVTARACYTRPPTDTPNTDAFIEVDEVTLKGDVRRIYTGWMYAASPGLHAVEHPIYDIWLTDCKKPPQAVADTSAEKPKDDKPPAPRRASTPRPRAPAGSAPTPLQPRR